LTLYQPTSVADIFGNWLNGVVDRFKKHTRVGAIAIIWLLWLCRNDKVFTKKTLSLLQVIYRCIGTLHLWSSLQKVEYRDLFLKLYARLEATTRDIFPYMDGSIITVSDFLRLWCRLRRFYSFSMWYVDLPFFCFLVETWTAAVCILVMQRPGVMI
jgi:hypothetical protein